MEVLLMKKEYGSLESALLQVAVSVRHHLADRGLNGEERSLYEVMLAANRCAEAIGSRHAGIIGSMVSNYEQKLRDAGGEQQYLFLCEHGDGSGV
jgi:hypothetical protein